MCRMVHTITSLYRVTTILSRSQSCISEFLWGLSKVVADRKKILLMQFCFALCGLRRVAHNMGRLGGGGLVAIRDSA